MADDNYICHYGVKGMRWGVRKAEVRSDNAKASQLGKKATYDQYAYEAAKHRADKYTKKYGNSTKTRHVKKLNAALENKKILKKNSESSMKDMKEHYNSLIKKYGKENVKDIKYDKRGFLNEGKDFERSLVTAGITAASIGIAVAAGIPFAPITMSLPSPTIGTRMENRSYARIYNNR